MARRFLAVVGLLALIGLAGAGIAALVLIPGKVSVTIANDAAKQKAGPDAVSLLRDDVSSLRRDVAALAQTLSRNFETLGARGDASQAPPDAAESKDALARLADVRAALARSEARGDALAARQDDLVRAVNDLAARVEKALAARLPATVGAPGLPAASGPSASPIATAAVGANGPPPPAPSAPRPAGTLPPPAPVVDRANRAPAAGTPAIGASPATPPVATGKRRSFLSFTLPSEGGFRFDEVQRFEVIPDLSRVGFDGKSTIHDFSGVTTSISGGFTARLSSPGAETSGRVEASAASLDTGLTDRDKDMRDLLDVARFPTISFVLASFATTRSDPKAMTLEGTARGTLTIHGVAREVAWPLQIAVDESRRVSVEGELAVRLTDYGLKAPSKLGVVNMENEVRVWLNLRARSAGSADAAAAGK